MYKKKGNEMTPFFSIVIPVYNVEEYIDECLNSIIPQVCTFEKRAEIILIDDGSTDRSGMICDNYGYEFPEFIKVIHKTNEGLLLARRTGFCHAEGEYIINCDSDDIVEKTMLKELFDIIEKTQKDVILFNVNKLVGAVSEEFYFDVFCTGEYTDVSMDEVMKSFFLDEVPVVTGMCGKTFKRSCLDVNKDYTDFLHNSFGEDTVQSAEIYSKKPSVGYYNRALYYYRMGSGMTAKCDEHYFVKFKAVLKKIREYKESFEIDNFDDWYVVKSLNNMARAITQTRYHKQFRYRNFKKMITLILQDSEYTDNIKNLKKHKSEIKKSYYILLCMLKKKLYFILFLSLVCKNCIDR